MMHVNLRSCITAMLQFPVTGTVKCQIQANEILLSTLAADAWKR